jgi:hypothetical protein
MTQIQNKHTQTSSPQVEFESTTQVFERLRQFVCQTRSAALIGLVLLFNSRNDPVKAKFAYLSTSGYVAFEVLSLWSHALEGRRCYCQKQSWQSFSGIPRDDDVLWWLWLAGDRDELCMYGAQLSRLQLKTESPQRFVVNNKTWRWIMSRTVLVLLRNHRGKGDETGGDNGGECRWEKLCTSRQRDGVKQEVKTLPKPQESIRPCIARYRTRQAAFW